LRALAAAAADVPLATTPLPAASADDESYRQICRQALRVFDPQGWRLWGRAAREAGHVTLTGWPVDLLHRLSLRLRARGIEAPVHDPANGDAGLAVPLLVVLGERRPLDAERIGWLRRVAMAQAPVGLANLLTPEIDAPLVEVFTTILRSADCTDGMLDVVADRLLAADAP
jgi:hypothetical protein